MKTLILGKGYIGSALLESQPEFNYSKRKKVHPGSIVFDLKSTTSWKNIPVTETIIWTFPAKPLDLVKKFYEEKLSQTKNLIVLGSTSCYKVKRQKQKVNEETELDTQILRVQGEEYLRSQGATILSLAGIYGPNRCPKSWLYKGLIKNPDKYVNLIHVNDIVFAINHFINSPQKGERINIADGSPKSWREIGEKCDFHFRMPGERELSKLIQNDKLRSLLPQNYKFKELYSLWP